MITLLTGDNDYAIRQNLVERLDKVGDQVEVVRLSGEQLDPADLAQLFGGLSLFSPERLVVLRDVATNKNLWEALETSLENGSVADVIIVEPNPDKRTRTYKWLQKNAEIKEINQLNERELVDWAQGAARQRGANLESETARFLIHYIGQEQGKLAGELDKLALAGSPITRELIERISEPTPEASVFEVVDSLLSNQRERLSEQMKILRISEDPYRFFGLLSSQIYTLLVCLNAGQRTPQQIAKEVGLHPYVVQKSLPQAKRLGAARLKKMSDQLAQTDLQIKNSADEPWRLIELAVMKMTA